jgi:hypothetical protein
MAATLAAAIGRNYEDSGQRDPVRVYFNGGTVPGEKDRVYMEWTAEVIDSPYRGDNEFPADPQSLGQRMRDITTDSWIEFYELMTPDKEMDLST